jgi:hypothetical protein
MNDFPLDEVWDPPSPVSGWPFGITGMVGLLVAYVGPDVLSVGDSVPDGGQVHAVAPEEPPDDTPPVTPVAAEVVTVGADSVVNVSTEPTPVAYEFEACAQ